MLWKLTIIGGVIKHYSYFLVSYILAENPLIKLKDAINLSRKMMNEYKFKLFLLQLSLLPRKVLSIITIGLSDILYFDLYKEFIYSTFYMELRNKYKDDKVLSRDKILDGKLIEGVYPEEKLEKRFSSSKLLRELEYDRKCSVISLI